ncbi:MAG: NADH-quinone oxidoreductase subunit NuoN, partial [Pseudonocardiaceae bacterium]
MTRCREATDVLGTGVLAQGQPVQIPGIDYGAIAPVLIVLGAACLAVLVEAFVPRSGRWATQVTLTLLALVLAGASLGAHLYSGSQDGGVRDVITLAGTVAVDRPALFMWGTLLALGLAAALLIADRSIEPGGAFTAHAAVRPGTAADRTINRGPHAYPGSPTVATQTVMQTEVFPLFLFSLSGMMVFLAANDLLTMFIALEVLSLPLYVMAGLARRRRQLSQEAAVKYFLLGAFASAFFLYGLAMLYGYARSVKLSDIAEASGGTDRSDALLFAGLALLVIGLLFKASVGPFHAWTPDVYQGAPTPATAFMAACTKVAAFGAFLRVLTVGFGATEWEWRGVLAGVAVVSMVIGAVLGLTQTDIKRMIAYSSVAHAGFLLLGAIAVTAQGVSSTLFYLLAYGFTTLAAFGIVTLVRDAEGEATHLSQWAGLAQRSPLTAGVFAFLLFALAGIPLTSGFTAKFAVFSAAIADGMA